jgi:hypothetical protein
MISKVSIKRLRVFGVLLVVGLGLASFFGTTASAELGLISFILALTLAFDFAVY